MKQRVNPDLVKDIEKFGVLDWNECFHCGNCTAVCPITEQGFLFPRKGIRAMQMGLKDTLTGYVEPWLCYYCGDCSKTCPRNANPGEIMMSMRRYLTSVYDWTGIAKKLYISKVWELSAIFLLAAIVFVIWALVFGLKPPSGNFNALAPAEIVHIIDMIVAIMLAGLLLSFVFNMYLKTLKKEKNLKIPVWLYITELGKMIFHFIFQWRFSECETDPKSFFKRLGKGKFNFWIIHFLLMSGYALLFLMIVFFLSWFQGNDDSYHWWNIQRILGFYGTLVLVIGTIYFLIRRSKNDIEKSKYSHATDWTFIIMLLLTTITGIAIFFCRIGNAPLLGFYVYLIHLMVAIPMLMIEVPFSKWAHLAYRPVAVYFANIKKAALKLQNKQ